ncbi:MAG: CmcI family methyltransferase, partial [Solirubrobacteraceae bacterium]
MDLDRPVEELWHERAEQVLYDTYAGVPLSKFPEDLRTYEHILWHCEVDVVVELGTNAGGSALWFRDRLRDFAAYREGGRTQVISVDLGVDAATHALAAVDPDYARTITLLSGDVRDPGLAEQVAGLVPAGVSCLVIDDSGHTYETTRAALDGFSGLVRPGGFFVVEDGCVDIEQMRVRDDWPRGVLPAVADWLATEPGSCFLS